MYILYKNLEKYVYTYSYNVYYVYKSGMKKYIFLIF